MERSSITIKKFCTNFQTIAADYITSVFNHRYFSMVKNIPSDQLTQKRCFSLLSDKLSSSFAEERAGGKYERRQEEERERERHLDIIGQRGMHREALHSERCEMERHKRE